MLCRDNRANEFLGNVSIIWIHFVCVTDRALFLIVSSCHENKCVDVQNSAILIECVLVLPVL